MIGVVVPAHNEQACLDACLASLRAAAAHPGLQGEAVNIVVVLDACSDGSAEIVARHVARAPHIAGLPLQARNVGAARAAGAAQLMAQGARWLAFTDADTRVSPAWLATQLSLDSDAVCGSVTVDDWCMHHHHAARLSAQFADGYTDVDGHGHIHGANLGVSAVAYARAGGFPPLACSEDVALVEALQRSGARIAWSAAPRVATSARRDARARGGFGDTLLALAAGMAAGALPLLLPSPTDPI